MKAILPLLFTALGGILGKLFGYLSMLAVIPVLIASEILMPVVLFFISA